MDGPLPPDDPIEDLMARCLEAPLEERASRLERLCGEHPVHAAELRARFEVLRAMGLGYALEGSAPAAMPERLGDFRLIERLGGGGMGVVYRALQLSLGREVALKVVRPELCFFPGAQLRFQREVEAVARLKHPGIVPVYAVGHERGLPYFAMELVEGCTLADVLSALAGRDPATLGGQDLAAVLRGRGIAPEASAASVFAGSWVDACLALARDVADALAHAHSRGIVHRDVKPSNVVLSPRGRAVLLDFGLTSSGAAERLTSTGTQPGTPLYMAPEQVRGERVDARADVYALGVTLHELLALEPRFQGRDPLALRAAILEGRAQPLRERNPRVPRDVEAIVRVASDLAPERRYASASLLARDLEHALARRPVLARPPGAGVLTLRWVRRHPTASTAAALGLLLAAGVPSALYVQQSRHARELDRSLERETRARSELSLANTGLEEALARERGLLEDEREARLAAEASVNFLFNLVHEATPERLQGRTFSLETWLERGLATLDELSYRPEFTGLFLMFAGEALVSLGKLDRAAEVLRQAVEAEAARGGAPSGMIPRIQSALATALQRRGRFDEAEELFREALAGYREANGEESVHVAIARNNLGNLLLEAGRLAEAEEELGGAIATYAKLADRDLGTLIVMRSNRAHLLVELGFAREAIDEGQRTLADVHSLPEPDLLLEGSVLNLLARARRKTGDLGGAESDLRAALERYERVYSGPDARTAAVRFALGEVLEDLGRRDEALELFARCADDLQSLGLADHRDAAIYRLRRDALAQDP